MLRNVINSTAAVDFHLFPADPHRILQQFSQFRKFQILHIDECMEPVSRYPSQCQWAKHAVLDPIHIGTDDLIPICIAIDIIQTRKLADIKINYSKLILICILFQNMLCLSKKSAAVQITGQRILFHLHRPVFHCDQHLPVLFIQPLVSISFCSALLIINRK